MRTIWTPERIEELRAHAAAGMSAAKVATAMGIGVKAVTSAAHRHKISLARCIHHARSFVPTMDRPRPVGSVWDDLPKARIPRDGVASLMREPGNGVPLASLSATDCRWPVFGAGADTRFCGCEREAASQYCPAHAAIAYGRAAA